MDPHHRAQSAPGDRHRRGPARGRGAGDPAFHAARRRPRRRQRDQVGGGQRRAQLQPRRLDAARGPGRGGGGGDHQALPAQAARHVGQHLQAHRAPARLRHRRRAHPAEAGALEDPDAAHRGDRAVRRSVARDARHAAPWWRRPPGPSRRAAPPDHSPAAAPRRRRRRPTARRARCRGRAAEVADTTEDTAPASVIEEPATDAGEGEKQ